MITIASRVDQYAKRLAFTGDAYTDYLDGRTEAQLEFYEQRRERLVMFAQTLIDLGIDVKEYRKFPSRYDLVKTHAIKG